MQPIGAHCCEVMYLGCFGFRGELGFLNCDNVCMCVVSFFLIPFMLTCSMMRFLSLLLLGLCPCVVSVVMWSCGHLWSVYEVVVVLYVEEVVAVTVMRVLLFVLNVCLLRECDGARLTALLVWGWMRCGECGACGWYTWFR